MGTPARHTLDPGPGLVADGGLVEWRRRLLERAGFEHALATRLGADSAFDVHALIELVEAGCPPCLAARILAPLDPELQC